VFIDLGKSCDVAHEIPLFLFVFAITQQPDVILGPVGVNSLDV
jgi:hypothetical protein